MTTHAEHVTCDWCDNVVRRDGTVKVEVYRDPDDIEAVSLCWPECHGAFTGSLIRNSESEHQALWMLNFNETSELDLLDIMLDK